MKNLICALLVSGAISPAFAKDSTWLLCKGQADLFGEKSNVVANVFEHRSGVDTRATELSLIYGGYVLTGHFDSTENNFATVNLSDKKSNYQGLAAVDYQTNTLTLNGTLNVGATTVLSLGLKCDELGN